MGVGERIVGQGEDPFLQWLGNRQLEPPVYPLVQNFTRQGECSVLLLWGRRFGSCCLWQTEVYGTLE